MKKIFYTAMLFLGISCNSGRNTNNSSDSANTTKGNSPGSNIQEMDTLHIDTSGHSISTDRAKH